MPTIENKVASVEHVSDPSANQPVGGHAAAGTSVRRRQRQPYDDLSVTPNQMKEWGIQVNPETQQAGEGLRWVRNKNTNVWDKAPEDRIAALQYQLPGLEPVRVDGKIVTRNDVMLVKYPIEYDIEAQEAIDAEANRIAGGLRQGAEGILEGKETYGINGKLTSEMSQAEKEALHEQQYYLHRSNGMIGPTQNMDLPTAIRVSGGPERSAEESERFRRGASHRELTQEEWSQNFVENVVPSNRGVRAFIGASGLGRDTQTKVAERSAAGRRAAALAAPTTRK